MLIKHGTELLSRHKVLLRTMAHGATPTQTVRARVRGERGYRIGLLTHLAGNGWEADYTIPAHTRTKCDATTQYNMMMMTMQFSAAMH